MDKKNENKKHFPPVVAVLGHVDHGKTTLLDAIRKTSIAEREHGGITQKIGASGVEIEHEGEKRKITFIDTPGHEAFSKMRGRGAQAADIGLLIVSAVDGVMPQTKESITLLKESGIPFIVVLTKMDSEQKNPDKARQQLLKESVLIEGYGGDIPIIEVSAKTGDNIKELLDLILLVFDLRTKDEKISEDSPFKGIVIESKQDPKAGAKATIVIKNGKINIRDEVFVGEMGGRIRTIITDKGEQLKEATVGDAVEILGFDKAPEVGTQVTKGKKDEATDVKPHQFNQPRTEEDDIINLILAADTLGSLEAIINSLPPKINVISRKTGDITTADVLLAKSVGALVLGFNTRVKPDVLSLASTEKVLVKNYTIIYEMLDEINDAVSGKELSMMEEVYGTAKVMASFPFEKTKVLGVTVTEGRVAKGDKARIQRGDEVVGEATISSLRQGKGQISKVEQGQEAGIILSPYIDFNVGDVVICHN